MENTVAVKRVNGAIDVDAEHTCEEMHEGPLVL